jgi:hypothetical protein
MREGDDLRVRSSAGVALKVGAVLYWLAVGAAPNAPLVAQIREWAVEATPRVSIGDGGGPGHDLFAVRDALLRADGTLLVLSAGTDDIRVFSSTGQLIRTVGREGEGPGEFKSPAGFTLLPNGHLLVYDSGNIRVTELDGDLEMVGTERVAYDVQASSPAFARRRPMLDGAVPLAVYETPFFQAVSRDEGVYEEDLLVQILRGTEVQATVRRPRGPVYLARDGNTGITLPLPMGEFVLFNWGPAEVVLGSSHSNEFELWDTSGRLVGSVRADGAPRRATAADMAAYNRRTRVERSGSRSIPGVQVSSAQVQVEKFLKDAPRGEAVPMFDRVEVGERGYIWIRAYVLNQETTWWQVLDRRTGTAIARVAVPSRWELLRASPTHLVVLERDEYDVELVRVYGLRN